MPFCMWKHTDTSTRIKKTELAQYARVPVVKKKGKEWETTTADSERTFLQ